jgi:peptide deformylase
MFDVMYFFNGIGLAAQQVRSNKRVLIVDLSNDSSSFEGSYDVNTNEKIATLYTFSLNNKLFTKLDRPLHFTPHFQTQLYTTLYILNK